jgi:hypothetical protein
MSGSNPASSASVSVPAHFRVLGKRKAAEKCRTLMELLSGKTKIPRLESPEDVPTTPVHGTLNQSNDFSACLSLSLQAKVSAVFTVC